MLNILWNWINVYYKHANPIKGLYLYIGIPLNFIVFYLTIKKNIQNLLPTLNSTYFKKLVEVFSKKNQEVLIEFQERLFI